MIRKGDFIKHEKFLDACFEVKKCYDYGHGIVVTGVWWNQGFVESFSLGIKGKIEIAKLDSARNSKRKTSVSEWLKLSGISKLDSCLRFSDGWNKLGLQPYV